MVVAVLALVFALAGTAWAALGKNSVGSKQLKKNAVTTAKIKKEAVNGAKVKKDSLTGTQINEAKLGTVPSAQLANTIPPAEATHLIGAPGEPGFENGASNVGILSGIHLNPAGFYKDHEGIVHLEGAIKVPSKELKSVFTLPAGYRPPAGILELFQPIEEITVAIGGTGAGVESIDLSGKVAAMAPGELLVLEGITFRAGG
jgi:hypothetical protein